jgi:hypothetical protein
MKTMPKNPLTIKPTHFRSSTASGIKPADGAPQIDFRGGDAAAGLIRGAAIATRGEALGHGMWLDGEFVTQCAGAMTAASAGIKMRFTHPGVSSDGLGSYLGRVKAPLLDGDVLRGDLHFAQSARKTPDGDLADYLLGLAQEDPRAFGLSIVFDRDLEAEEAFALANGAEWVEDEWFGQVLSYENFVSPDPQNIENLPHCRLFALYAADVVDDPAANPEGLFHRQSYAREADELLSYSLGLSTKAPQLTALAVDPDRVQQFVRRFLSQHNLQLIPKEPPMANATPPAAAMPAAVESVSLVTAADPEGLHVADVLSSQALAAAGQRKCAQCGAFSIPVDGKCAQCGAAFAMDDEMDSDGGEDSSSNEGGDAKYGVPRTGEDYLNAFGEFGAVCFAEGKTWDETQTAFVAKVQAENESLKAKLAAVPESFGEAAPLSGTAADMTADPKHADLERKLGSANLARFAASIQLPKAK